MAATHADLRNNDWYRVAAGKGVWLLHSLRRQMGGKAFDAMMEAFGREHAGKAVTAAQFQSHVEKWVGNSRGDFFDAWLNETGLPRYQVAVTGTTSTAKGHEVTVEVRRDRGGPQTALDVTVETVKGDVTREVRIDGTTTRMVMETSEPPLRVVLDKYGQAAKGNGGPFSILTPQAELEQTLIIYGTADERSANREAAEALRQAIRERGSNITVAIRADKSVIDTELQSHHLLLIGRPETNMVVKRFQDALPISFGRGSFAVRQEVYAHPDSAILVAAENPTNTSLLDGGPGRAGRRLDAAHRAAGRRAAHALSRGRGGAARWDDASAGGAGERFGLRGERNRVAEGGVIAFSRDAQRSARALRCASRLNEATFAHQ